MRPTAKAAVEQIEQALGKHAWTVQLRHGLPLLALSKPGRRRRTSAQAADELLQVREEVRIIVVDQKFLKADNGAADIAGARARTMARGALGQRVAAHKRCILHTKQSSAAAHRA